MKHARALELCFVLISILRCIPSNIADLYIQFGPQECVIYDGAKLPQFGVPKSKQFVPQPCVSGTSNQNLVAALVWTPDAAQEGLHRVG